jgi:ABC-type sugar transport system ATPase subunit
MATLSLRGVQKTYGPTRVLERVDCEVGDGEYVVLVGPSGCGKSTLLRCIAGLEEITGGDLFIGDRRANDVAPRDRGVAMVFQSYALYPHMTVRENMGFALKVAKTPPDEIRRRVDEAAELLALTPLLERLPSQLSGGQRQRVAMGRAIVRRPSVFLFDEPLSNLDPALRGHMRVELKRLHRTLGATIVHVTHDQVEALTLADRILVLDRGAVQQIGAPRELFDRPANTFVATFIGAPAMNLLPAAGRGATSRIEGVDVDVPVAADGPYVLGLRPSDLSLGDGGLPGVVDVIESLGAEALVHVRVGPHDVVVRQEEPCPVRPGDAVSVRVGVAHRFDRDTRRRIEP